MASGYHVGQGSVKLSPVSGSGACEYAVAQEQ